MSKGQPMKLIDKIEDSRKLHNIHSILGTEKRKIICPLPDHTHHNHTPSFSIFWRGGVQRFHCHGSCGAEGDVIDLVGYLRIPGYDRNNRDQRLRALQLLDGNYKIEMVVPERDTLLEGNEWREFVPAGPEAIEYARKRGLTRETLEKFRVGQFERLMSMPCFEEERCVGVKMRSTTGKRYLNLAGSRSGLFHYDAVYLTTRPVFIVKAEIPCMLLDQLGFLACAPTGGESAYRQSGRWRTALALAPKVVIGDNDRPGREQGPLRAALLAAELRFPPDPYKDLDEFYLAEPERAVEMFQRWREEIL